MTDGRVELSGAPVDYRDLGTGPVVVFVHGVYVGGRLWDDVVDRLGPTHRCVVPTWPLGAHDAEIPAGVDLSAEATARRIPELLEALDLHDVTVVANDTGGGLTLAALGTAHPGLSRIGALVLTNCDSFDHFPPPSFAPMVRLCRLSTRAGRALMWLFTTGPGKAMFFNQVCASKPSKERITTYLGAFATSARSRRDAVSVTRSMRPAITEAAAPALRDFARPVRVVWGEADKVFPKDDGRRIAETPRDGSYVPVPGSGCYVMIDAPDRLAAEILATTSRS